MDYRTTKVIDFATASRNMTDNLNKCKRIQLKWLRDYQWLCDKYRELGKKLDELCNEDQVEEKKSLPALKDKRSCLPLPQTNNQNFGWLASKPEFKLEKYGSSIVKYPHPMDDLIFLTGDVPSLAGHLKIY
ncbi:hypothetical protein QAD02_012454 [Eretmocerus hayati]|uniref:Uncharacterized protein n=1 Tax=Eretmocerus hayati TaxID=131215 RepID=A0ACC2NZR5_9HYME|nr:hypothetical protein QAD02_012454 [Eretmocerus hayati]